MVAAGTGAKGIGDEVTGAAGEVSDDAVVTGADVGGAAEVGKGAVALGSGGTVAEAELVMGKGILTSTAVVKRYETTSRRKEPRATLIMETSVAQ